MISSLIIFWFVFTQFYNLVSRPTESQTFEYSYEMVDLYGPPLVAEGFTSFPILSIRQFTSTCLGPDAAVTCYPDASNLFDSYISIADEYGNDV